MMTKSPKICFIGSGNLATQLSKALYKKGFPILQVYSRTEEAAKELATQLNCTYTTHANQLTSEADLYICALKDSVITEVLNQAKEILNDKLVVHTAGSVPMKILANYTTKFGVLYPMQTFTKVKTVDFSKVPFLLEGSTNEITDYLKDITSHLSEKLYKVSSEDRKRIHLAAVFVSNFANHTYTLGAELAKASGLPFDVLLPLIDETAEKVHTVEPIKAQSGPAVRYDQNVMAMHSEMLKDQPMMQKIYELMSDSIHQYAMQSTQK